MQWTDNGGRCGICGDPWSDFPRQHEAPLGKYATGEDKLEKLKPLCSMWGWELPSLPFSYLQFRELLNEEHTYP